MAGWQSLGVSAETLHAIASDVSAETPCHAAERNPGRFTSRGNRVTSLPAHIVHGSRDAAIPLARAELIRDGLVGPATCTSIGLMAAYLMAARWR